MQTALSLRLLGSPNNATLAQYGAMPNMEPSAQKPQSGIIGLVPRLAMGGNGQFNVEGINKNHELTPLTLNPEDQFR
jgi:hypothetical protein